MSRRRIVPVFVSGNNCPQRCVYCDQAGQTGETAPASVDAVREAIARAGSDGDVAFYGGTFTGLKISTQELLLAPAAEALAAGKLRAIRVSTHPRWCGQEHLERLKRFGVSLVELGVQSLDDTVLSRCRRGVDAAETMQALANVRKAGLSLGVQLMPGLPGASRVSDQESARILADVGAVLARVYPTVVLRGTELEHDWKEGSYESLSPQQAVARAADQVFELESGGVKVQRIGLHVDAALKSSVVAGVVDEALGEKVRSELAYRKLQAMAKQLPQGKSLKVEVPRTELSQWLGWRRENLSRFASEFPDTKLSIHPG